MGRLNLVNPSTLQLTAPSAGALINAIGALQQAQQNFYEQRRNIIASYPGFSGSISAADVEARYDSLYGADPWNYLARVNGSGSTRRTPPTPVGFWVAQRPFYYVVAWAGTPGSEIEGVAGYGYDTGYIRYEPDIGAPWIDLAFEGNIGGFRTREPLLFTSITSGAGDGQSVTTRAVATGFGEVPVAWNGGGGLTGRQAHMLHLLGTEWNATCNAARGAYSQAFANYQSQNGSGPGYTFATSNQSSPWDGYQGTPGTYNRGLNAEIVRELRGIT